MSPDAVDSAMSEANSRWMESDTPRTGLDRLLSQAAQAFAGAVGPSNEAV